MEEMVRVSYEVGLDEESKMVILCVNNGEVHLSFDRSQLRDLIRELFCYHEELRKMERRHKYLAKKLVKEAEKICQV